MVHTFGQQQQAPVPAQFAPQTLINSTAEGIQVVVSVAPQVNTIVWITIEQMKEAMQRCLTLRQSAGLAPSNIQTTGR